MTDELKVLNARIEIVKQYKSKSRFQLIKDLKQKRKKSLEKLKELQNERINN